MQPRNVRCRTVIQEGSYESSLKERQLAQQKVDEALEGVVFALSRAPEIFPAAPGGLSRLRVNAPAYGLTLNIWFRFDDDNVYLLQLDQVGENGEEQ